MGHNNDKKDKGFAIGGTILFHALAILLLFTMAFRTPLPLPGEEGVEVDLGMMDQGMGEKQPERPAEQQASQPKQEQNNEDIVTNNDEAPALEQPKNTKTKPKKETEEPKQEVNQNALYKNGNKSQTGGSEGITGQPGDQGKPNGLADIHQYDGSGGGGGGVKYDLGGRGHKRLFNDKIDNLPEQGIVVVDIWVDPAGNVIRAKAGAKGTNTLNAVLRKKAEEYALASKFVNDPDAPKEQHGTITYTFVFNL